jgi:hypothetical protein
MKDFLNDQIDEAELCGEEDMLAGLIGDEDDLEFERADAPSLAELAGEERQIGTQSMAAFTRAPEEADLQGD